jgi:tRNA nucleotidyltransferase/poly(A) polymerase
MPSPAVPLLARLSALTREQLYLVGGSLRDLLAGCSMIRDFDLLTPAGAETLARRFAKDVGGSFFFLDEERGIARVVLLLDNAEVRFDFANFEGESLEADLARRDFTVNAMAIDVREFIATGALDGLIDPYGGRADVRMRSIRTSNPKVFDEDPLRLLRAVRFAATLGFTIDQRTSDEIRSRSALATLPAPERCRDELFLILSVPKADRNLELMDSLGLLQVLLPELAPLRDFAPGKHHHYDILTHSFRTAGYTDFVLEELGSMIPDRADDIREHLGHTLEHGIMRSTALRFACLLHDIAKAETYFRDESGEVHFYGHDQAGADAVKGICARFRLSRTTTGTVERLVRHHMRPLALATSRGPSNRALYRYCRDLQDAVPESIVLALADARATAEVMPEGFTDTRKTAQTILEYYYGKYLRTEDHPLVTGKDLIALGMKPGPVFRGILDDVKEKQAAGAFKSRDEALRYVRSGEQQR